MDGWMDGWMLIDGRMFMHDMSPLKVDPQRQAAQCGAGGTTKRAGLDNPLHTTCYMNVTLQQFFQW